MCSCCGHKNKTLLPTHLKAPIQFGTNLSAILAYLFANQYLLYNLIKTAMQDLFNITLSEGTVNNILAKITANALPTKTSIKARLQESMVIGGDETGTKIHGNIAWCPSYNCFLNIIVNYSFNFFSILVV